MLLVTSGIRAYEQLGLRAFGHTGKILAAVIITLHNIGGMVHRWYSMVAFSVFVTLSRWVTRIESKMGEINGKDS